MSAILPTDESPETRMLQIIPGQGKAGLPGDSPGLWVNQLLPLITAYDFLSRHRSLKCARKLTENT